LAHGRCARHRELNPLQNALPKAVFPAIDHRLDMQGFLTICAVMGALGLAACGSPSELDDGAFPSLDKTGYAASGSSGTTPVVLAGQGGSAGAVSSGGSSGSLASANGGSAPTGSGANTGTTSGGSAGTNGAAAGGTNGAGTAGTNGAGTSGCPTDITVLFSRPIAQGGCTSGGGCHEATSVIKPDLVSPNVAARLLNVASTCSKTSSGMSVQPRPYIGKDDSFLEEKISGTPDSSCGISMPFFMPDALNAADEQCIIQWIDQVAGG
jgi:hypothetical protein